MAALCLAAALAATSPAAAHRRAAEDDGRRGVSLPAVSHDEMRIVADYRPAILALAARQRRTDEEFRRIVNFQNIQFAYCAWGLAPGSVTDEDSPFNECSHAYLAASKALLSKMAAMPDAAAEAQALADRMQRAVDAAPRLVCRFGEEPFDTAHVVYPDWRLAPDHAPTLTAAIAAGLLATACGFALYGIGAPRRGRAGA